ncbi:MAG: hypothetical protein KJ970_19900 [Candidatus Eisenbacteria bacterium]|uniref:Uncharacterized protein n=1 Tax=Eiseniibacteriota bacterium TaxID=2212470 RepID=A0A948RZD0_UNCEI|nr:hypothetical protein [Candidatus Eisenbacteria bacterium]MBU1950326.1 hypothetical protein [Candidatus Eisenbacteria bacterium]MBU2693186.1 hypothetical protein [Candidatus Eisenbacteria bacterium]
MSKNRRSILLILTMVSFIAPLAALGISPLTTGECTAIPWSEDNEYSMIPPAFCQNGFADGELEIEISWKNQSGEEECLVIHFPGTDEASLSRHSEHKCPFCSLVALLLSHRAPENRESPLTGFLHRPFTILYRVFLRPAIAIVFPMV